MCFVVALIYLLKEREGGNCKTLAARENSALHKGHDKTVGVGLAGGTIYRSCI